MSSQYEYDPTRIAGSGEVVEGTAGGTIANRDICCVVNGLYYRADADLAARMPAFALAMSNMAPGQRGEFLVKGFIGLSTWTWTPGSALYVSGTAGQMSHAAGGIRQDVGVAFTATQIFINSQGLDASTPCALLEGATAYVGFDNCKGALFTNYFLCDGVADDVQIQAAIDYVVALGGGRILLEAETYNLGATGLTIDVTTANIEFGGLGEETIIQFTGAASYAITVTGDGISYKYIKLFDFKIDGIAKTAGRSGVYLNTVAPRSYVDNVYCVNLDIGIKVFDTNSIWMNRIVGDVCNTGLEIEHGGTTLVTPFRVSNPRFVLCANYGIHLNGSGNSITIEGGSFSNNGNAIYASENRLTCLHIKDCYMENHTDDYDIKLIGFSAGFPIASVVIDNCYFNGNNTTTSAIYVKWVRRIEIRSPYSHDHTNSMIFLDNFVPNNILVINPSLGPIETTPDPYLLDGTLTQLETRLGGMVIEDRRIGVIALGSHAGDTQLVEGDVVYWGAADGYVYSTNVANQDTPGVIMYGQLDTKPMVVAIKGITPVKMNNAGAVAHGDTIVTQNAHTEGLVNNAQTDPKKIIGYSISTKGAAAPGTVLTRIL